MTIIEAVVLGVVQGLTEFLPISSSGHLVLVQKLFGMETGSVALELLMHLGTLVVVCGFYFRELWEMVCHPWKSNLKWLVLATMPAVILRLLYTDLFVKLLSGTAGSELFARIRDGISSFMDNAFSGGFLGWAFLLTGTFLLLGEWLSGRRGKRHKRLRGRDAIAMGLMQAVAVLPGVSRSGSTIAGGRAMGLSGRKTADFAFLMSVPTILGAVVMDSGDISAELFSGTLPLLPVIVGVATSMVFGAIAIGWMRKAVRRAGMRYFAAYVYCIGLLVLVDQYVTHLFF